MTHFRKAIVLAPGLAYAHEYLGIVLLRLGQFEAGWQEFEGRRQRGAFKAAMPPVPPEIYWTGNEDLRGRTISITDEQGIGDAIQFFRYVRLVKARGARVIYHAHRGLRSLFAASMPEIEVVEGFPAGLKINYFCSVLSLPRALKTTMSTIPADIPYIRAEPERVAKWTPRLAERSGYRVGLAWSGNPRNIADSRRSIPAHVFLDIATVPGVAFYSLQHDIRADDRAAVEANAAVMRIGEAAGDVVDTAAIIEQLDLVITVDTAWAHLAGALGKSVWVLLSFVPDWRWLMGRDDSPWYPTARLFRQESPGDWATVVERVRATLTARLARERGNAG